MPYLNLITIHQISSERSATYNGRQRAADGPTRSFESIKA